MENEGAPGESIAFKSRNLWSILCIMNSLENLNIFFLFAMTGGPMSARTLPTSFYNSTDKLLEYL